MFTLRLLCFQYIYMLVCSVFRLFKGPSGGNCLKLTSWWIFDNKDVSFIFLIKCHNSAILVKLYAKVLEQWYFTENKKKCCHYNQIFFTVDNFILLSGNKSIQKQILSCFAFDAEHCFQTRVRNKDLRRKIVLWSSSNG